MALLGPAAQGLGFYVKPPVFPDTIAGAVAATQADDGWAAASNAAASGAVSYTQAADTWALASNAKASGTEAIAQAADVWAATASGKASAAVAFTQAADAWALTSSGKTSGTEAWTQAANAWALSGSAATPVTGAVAITQAGDSWALTSFAGSSGGRRFSRSRRVLITVNGARFQVPEEDVEQWLARQEEKIVEKVQAKPKKAWKIKPPKIATKDPEIRQLVALANDRIKTALVDLLPIYAESDDDEEIELLMLL